jgi:hypothetical protein
MNDLTKLANIAEIVSALIVIGGLIFAVLHMRQEQDCPELFEWFQWLAERLEQDPSTNDDPAYISHKSWIPSNMTNDI